jgi:hypothetical protein
MPNSDVVYISSGDHDDILERHLAIRSLRDVINMISFINDNRD